MGKKILVCLSLLIAVFTTVCFGEDDKTIIIQNKSGNTIYVYNYDTVSKLKIAEPIKVDDGKTIPLTLELKDKMRIYFANARLSGSIEKDGIAPDCFNVDRDALVMYSFVEYNYSTRPFYTFDLSYIDEYSYPVTVTFTNVPPKTPEKDYRCKDAFEYGIMSLSAVKNALNNRGDYEWGALVWPDQAITSWNPERYKDKKIFRVVGPNKLWPLQDDGNEFGGVGPWVPTSYIPFVKSLSRDKYDLGFKDKDGNITNWLGWQNLTRDDITSPSKSGYVEALHSAAARYDKENDRYGFFCYPRDNADGEFTNLPDSTDCTVTIYPYDS